MNKLEEFLKLNPIQDEEEQKPIEKEILKINEWLDDTHKYEETVYKDGSKSLKIYYLGFRL